MEQTIGSQYLNELYGAWEHAADIDFDTLPGSFVLKTNNGCATNLFITDKQKADKTQLCHTLERWLETPYGEATGQIQYALIRPMIIAERLMRQSADPEESLTDYKFHCLNGKAVYTLVCANRSARSHVFDAMAYDMDWRELPQYVSAGFSRIKDMPRPASFEEMKAAAEKLAEPFRFARIDFYEVDGRPIFGEITLTPNMGGALSAAADEALFSLTEQTK